MNIAYLLIRAGQAFSESTAVAVPGGSAMSYRDLSDRVARLAGGLHNVFSAAPGDRVALIMSNGPAYIELLFACWHAGVTAVPVNAKLHPREFAFILGHSGARACFVSADLADAVAAACADLDDPPAVVSVESPDTWRLAAAEPIPLAETAPDDVAWLFYTSGTTGQPKGAMLTHRNLMGMTASYFADVDRIEPGDSILHAAPMSHGSGIYILPHVAAAALQIVPASGGFDPAEVLDVIQGYRGVTLFAAPTMVKRLTESPAAAKADTGNLKTIVYGGAPMYMADLDHAHSVFGYKLAQIYGQGESPMTITALNKARHAETDHPRYRERLASAGTAQLVVQVRVADEDGRTLPPGEPGEVLVRGESVMRGYWRNPEATATALRGGWLWTGDLGSMDADGFLTLRDRSKDVIISGGSNIYPREVEEVLLRHEAVKEVSVIGQPDSNWGEAVVAFVVPVDETWADASALDAHCLENIARFKRPKAYHFVEALPKNNYGKVLKTELRERLGTKGNEA